MLPGTGDSDYERGSVTGESWSGDEAGLWLRPSLKCSLCHKPSWKRTLTAEGLTYRRSSRHVICEIVRERAAAGEIRAQGDGGGRTGSGRACLVVPVQSVLHVELSGRFGI